MDQPAACEELVGLQQVHSALGSRAEMEQGRWVGGGGGGGGGGDDEGKNRWKDARIDEWI